MESTTMEINCWELKNGKEIPEPSTTTLNGFEWNARFRMTVSNDDGSLGLPFIFAADDTAILTVEKSEQEGKHTGNKKIKQVISCVPRSLGTEIVCSRTRSYDGNEHVWSAWEITSANSGVDVEWDMNADINTYVTEGIFNITGERLSAADGLPIENSAPGHTIHARLTVLDSSITGSGDNDDKCITQILALSNRTGGDGDVYIRTGRASIKNQLAGGSGWEPWGKLQQNVQVGQVTSLDGFTGNGMYSGVYTDGTLFETFVMVVINNYAVAGATGNVRCISQFKYALNVNSNFSYKTRTGRGGSTVEWGSWVDLGAATTTDIQDNSITVQKLSTALQEQINQNTANATKSANGAYWTSGPNAVTLNINKNNGTVGWQTLPAATTEKAGVMTAEDRKEQVKKTPLLNGDTIVGLAREVYSRQGKVDTATFLKRTTAGGTSISDGVATLKQIGGNIVKNLVDGTLSDDYYSGSIATITVSDGVAKIVTSGAATYGAFTIPDVAKKSGHTYYAAVCCCLVDGSHMELSFSNGYEPLTRLFTTKKWLLLSLRDVLTQDAIGTFSLRACSSSVGVSATMFFTRPLLIDLTEMFGAGNEPTKEECDKMFACMGALPQGLTVATPTALVSTGYNQFNPANVINGKDIAENSIISGDKHIAVIECLPCKTGTGENNGYVIGYGEGDGWSDEGIEVYLSPLNPITTDGELYMHKLSKDDTTNTYVPQIKGYLLVVTPTTDKLCAHLLWSGDRDSRDYEPFVESIVSLPAIPQMSEWGLAGLCSNVGANAVYDTIDLENKAYIRKIGSKIIKELTWETALATANGITYRYFFTPDKMMQTNSKCLLQGYGKVKQEALSVKELENMTFMAYDTGRIYLRNDNCSTINDFLASEGQKLVFYELIIPEEYPIVAKAAPNYIGSDYGVEEFAGGKVPLAANILFYMRSLVSETRNFLDRLMAGLGTSDATAVADRIVAAVAASEQPTVVSDEQMAE